MGGRFGRCASALLLLLALAAPCRGSSCLPPPWLELWSEFPFTDRGIFAESDASITLGSEPTGITAFDVPVRIGQPAYFRAQLVRSADWTPIPNRWLWFSVYEMPDLNGFGLTMGDGIAHHDPPVTAWHGYWCQYYDVVFEGDDQYAYSWKQGYI